MSQYNTSGHKAYVATSAIAGEGYIVKLSSGEVVVATAATDKFIGVTTNKAAAGEQTDIRLRNAQGTAKVKAGGTIAVGDYVTATTAGKAVATTTSGNLILGMALEAAADGDLFEVLLITDRY